jgi:hypothetical protein
MAVCAHAQTAIFFSTRNFGGFVPVIRFLQSALSDPRRRIRVARFIVVALPAATFAVFCAIYRFSRPLPGLHDARL